MPSRVFKKLFMDFPLNIVCIFFIDRLTKIIFQKYYMLGESQSVFERFNVGLNFTFAKNTGAAFSFLADAGGWQRGFFIFVTMVICLTLMVWLQKTPMSEKLERLALCYILGGALGNLYDRVRYGYVIDFIDVYYKQWHWPVFNVADSVICVGVGLLVLHMLPTVRIRRGL